MKAVALCAVLLISASCWAEQKYSATGMVLKVDPAQKTLIISCEGIPGVMGAMTMPFEVRAAKDLSGITPGTTVAFTMVLASDASYAEGIRIRPYESGEQDPLTARRLKLLNRLSQPSSAKPLEVGQKVPDFTLIDQDRHRIALSHFAGKVVAVNFIYTSCVLPQYCFRSTNTFAVLHKRFIDQMGRELILLTITFDPQRDGPEVLAKYARSWKADSATWHFLTGSVPEIQRVAGMFGMDYFPEEGLMEHSLHTAIIDRRGKLVANIEGNRFSPEQLDALVETVLTQRQRMQRTSESMSQRKHGS